MIVLLNFADSLKAAGDLKTAESILREADTIARKVYAPGTGRRDWARSALIAILRDQGSTEAIAELERDDAKQPEPSAPVAADAIADTADLSDAIALEEMSPTSTKPGAEKSSPAPGGTIGTLAQSAKPDDTMLFMKLTSLLAEAGDLAGYRDACHASLEHYSASQDATAARRVSKACLLAPLPSADTEAAARLAEFGLANSTEPKFVVQANLGKGLAEYRLGHFASAVGWMEKVIADPQANSPIKSHVNAAAQAVIASAQHQLDQADHSRASLAQALAFLKTARTNSGDGAFASNWQDALIAQVLVRQASELIEGQKSGSKAKSP